MNKDTKPFVAGASLLLLATLARADITLGPQQHPDPGVVTLRVNLVFDNELDQLLSISGNEDVSRLMFESDGEPLRQNCIAVKR